MSKYFKSIKFARLLSLGLGLILMMSDDLADCFGLIENSGRMLVALCLVLFFVVDFNALKAVDAILHPIKAMRTVFGRNDSKDEIK